MSSLFLCLLICFALRVQALPDACAGASVRPVILIPGFQGAPLYDSANKYDIEWPDVDAFGVPYGPGATDLDLPMQWDGLEQKKASVGPERFAGDDVPGLDGFFGDIFEFAVYRQLRRLASSWRHPTNSSLPMYYTASWDWRRDLWAEAPRIMKALRRVYETTGCKSILVGHSFGGRMLYTVLARHGKEAADMVAGALYAATPFHGSSTHVASLAIDPDVDVNLNRPPVDTLFTFPSVYTLGPSSAIACQNADKLFSKNTFPCPEGSHPTGINCDSAACGRPADWPAGDPFFLPLDLQDPDVWLKLGAAQPTLTEVTPEEEAHLRKALETARRASDVVSGSGVAAVQAIHPPAAVMSAAIPDKSFPPSPEKPAEMQHYITCVPSPSFGKPNAKEPWCADLNRGGSMPGDGTLNDFMMELRGPGWWRSIQTFRFVDPPKGWPPGGLGPHAAPLLTAENSYEELKCSEQKLPSPSCAGVNFPSLEELLCSLVYRAENPGAPAPEPSKKCVPEKPATWQKRFLDAVDTAGSAVQYWWRRFVPLDDSRDEL